jgi:hypothetical protein
LRAGDFLLATAFFPARRTDFRLATAFFLAVDLAICRLVATLPFDFAAFALLAVALVSL